MRRRSGARALADRRVCPAAGRRPAAAVGADGVQRRRDDERGVELHRNPDRHRRHGRPGYILTNGYCVGDVGRPAQRTTIAEGWFGTAEFLRAEGNLDGTLTVNVEEIAYSTMRHTDTAIVRLDATLGELEDRGIVPVPIAADEPAAGLDVVNIGVPVQDLDETDWVMRRGTCTLGAQHTLIEGRWLWFDAWSNDCPGIIQGSSGSPLFEVDADGAPQQIVGVINTTTWAANDQPGAVCTINHPCEVTLEATTMVPETSYAQPAAGIGACFDAATGVFALGGECPLPVSDVWALDGGGSFRGGALPNSVGATPEVNLSGAAGGTVRDALIPLGDGTGCTDPATYADAEATPLISAEHDWDQATVKAVDLPEVEGRYLLCAVRDEGYTSAASILFDVDRTPPTLEAGADIEDIGEGVVVVRPNLNPPELSNFRFTWGAPGEVDCDDTASFQGFFIVPLTLMPDDLPADYCIYGMDAAGNPTPVTRIEIAAP